MKKRGCDQRGGVIACAVQTAAVAKGGGCACSIESGATLGACGGDIGGNIGGDIGDGGGSDEDTHPVAVVVPPVGLALAVLAQRVVAERFGGAHVVEKRGVRRRGEEAVGPVADEGGEGHRMGVCVRVCACVPMSARAPASRVDYPVMTTVGVDERRAVVRLRR
eukprot:6185798-Pleurochrysis_carterae.AAC.1